MERGYAEPDPREDLSGRDAARKGLILARLLGYEGAPPRAEDLVAAVPAPSSRSPRSCSACRTSTTTGDDRVARAAAQGRVLRYVVTATSRFVGRARLAVPSRLRPIGASRGTRNLISFTTRRYRDEPLVITGPGAGAEVTAAGILNDIQHLAATE